MRPKLTLAAAVAALTLSLTGTASAQTYSEQAHQILSGVAGQVSHGFADYSLTVDQQEAKLARGERLSVLCGQVSLLGIRALQRAGFVARSVGAYSSQRYEMFDVPSDIIESHAMLEVWTGQRWELYDLDSNVQPVDADGQPVTIEQFASMPQRHYLPLADDVLYDPTDDQYPIYEQWVFANHEAWYDRVLDVVAVHQPASSAYVFTGPANSPVDGMTGFIRVSEQALTAWAAEPPVEAKPAVSQAAAVTPVAAPAALSAAAPTVLPAAVPVTSQSVPAAVRVAAPRKRFVTRVRGHKVFHVYGTGRKARWVFVRRTVR